MSQKSYSVVKTPVEQVHFILGRVGYILFNLLRTHILFACISAIRNAMLSETVRKTGDTRTSLAKIIKKMVSGITQRGDACQY